MKVFETTLTLTSRPRDVNELLEFLPSDELGATIRELITGSQDVLETELPVFNLNAILSIAMLLAHYEGGLFAELTDPSSGDTMKVRTILKMGFAIVTLEDENLVHMLYVVPYKGEDMNALLETLPYDGQIIVEAFLRQKEADFKLYSAWLERVSDDEFFFGAALKKVITVFERPIELQMRVSGKLFAHIREYTPEVPLADYSFKVPVISFIETSFRPRLLKAV